MAKEDPCKDISQVFEASNNIHNRLFNHKHFIDGEINYLVNKIEKKEWGDQEISQMHDRHKARLSQIDVCKNLIDLNKFNELQKKSEYLLRKSNNILNLDQLNEAKRNLQADRYSRRRQAKEKEIKKINQTKLKEVDKFYDVKKVEAAKYYHELESKWDV